MFELTRPTRASFFSSLVLLFNASPASVEAHSIEKSTHVSPGTYLAFWELEFGQHSRTVAPSIKKKNATHVLTVSTIKTIPGFRTHTNRTAGARRHFKLQRDYLSLYFALLSLHCTSARNGEIAIFKQESHLGADLELENSCRLCLLFPCGFAVLLSCLLCTPELSALLQFSKVVFCRVCTKVGNFSWHTKTCRNVYRTFRYDSEGRSSTDILPLHTSVNTWLSTTVPLENKILKFWNR